jgi:hypothetical protein
VLSLQVAELERLALLGDQQGVLHQLCWIVPTFAPVHGHYAAAAAADRANGRDRAPVAVDNRQSPVPDRRRSPRGGRRRSDRPQFPGSDLVQLTAQ